LLDAGEHPNRYNLEGNHPHSTPLHQAVLTGVEAVVRPPGRTRRTAGSPRHRLAGLTARLGALGRWEGAGGDGPMSAIARRSGVAGVGRMQSASFVYAAVRLMATASNRARAADKTVKRRQSQGGE
jgi:hypothetical protein